MSDFQRIADKIVYEVDKAVREAQNSWQENWKARSSWRHTRPAQNLKTAATHLKRMPVRLSDLATDGSIAMRYLFGYLLKGLAALQGFGGLMVAGIAVATKSNPWNHKELSIGLVLLATAQLVWWAGRLVHRSADRKQHGKDQHRLLRLAREKGGNLTVLEAATDGRLTVEKSEEILRELAARGHAEVRVSDSGLLVYHFPEIVRWDEKHWAKPVDEL